MRSKVPGINKVKGCYHGYMHVCVLFTRFCVFYFYGNGTGYEATTKHSLSHIQLL